MTHLLFRSGRTIAWPRFPRFLFCLPIRPLPWAASRLLLPSRFRSGYGSRGRSPERAESDLHSSAIRGACWNGAGHADFRLHRQGAAHSSPIWACLIRGTSLLERRQQIPAHCGINDATPSCLPGLIPPGKWNVLIGCLTFARMVQSHFIVHLYFSSTGSVSSEPAELNVPLKAGPAWYRGDLHMHTAQSDGECPSQTGKMVPCPVYFTADAAAPSRTRLHRDYRPQRDLAI